jgi:hypothetical protein
MMLEELRQQVYEANIDLPKYNANYERYQTRYGTMNASVDT